MEEMPFPSIDVEVPADLSQPEGMQVMFGDQEDRFAAFYYPDIEYVRYGERGMRLNMIRPAYLKGSLPLLIYVQGSGWRKQKLYEAIPQLSEFAHRGYIVASVEYRPSTEAEFPAQIQDVKSAIRYLRANAGRYGVDTARVAIWGDSSGGHMAALTGVSEGAGELLTEFEKDQSTSVKAVVDFYGPSDLLQMSKYPSTIDHDAPDSPGSLLLGGPIQHNKEKAAAANPIRYITKEKKLPPFLIMHGDRDEIVPFNQSVLLYEALRLAGQDVTFYKVKGAGHGPGFWSPEVLRVVRDFLKAHL
ncbi:alpha/beta hydrolase fold domain-containing protein [Paenibacillus chitinolyticus]|uniref:alpha/beta hydrolase fold domain-containing protein n=1 Tax=Paenibacillus chitinolyticus TaxID=79263 RepID=UPI00366CA697